MPTISRRHALLGAVGLGAAAVAVAAAPAYAGQGSARAGREAAGSAASAARGTPAADAAPQVPGRSAWLGLRGATLGATTAAGVILSVTLTAVEDLPSAPGDEDSYGLIFATSAPVDGIVTFREIGGAPAALYLSPVTQRQRTTAQAVIQRRQA